MITTFQQHIQKQQEDVSEASGTFSYLLAGITLATKMIQGKIRWRRSTTHWARTAR